MAKQPTSNGGTSKIRFIMLDVEVPQGDLSQITAAIQNALKPVTIINPRLTSSVTESPQISNANSEIADESEMSNTEELIDNKFEVTKQVRAQRVRRPTPVNVLDLDFESGVSLKIFSDLHPSKADAERFLVIAHWFKEHRATPVVTVNHIYTGYRKVGWPAGIEDFSQTFRYLKKQRLVSSPSRGEYEINHLGIDRVNRLSEKS